MFSSHADAVSDTISEQITSERIDDVLDKVPGGDMVREHIPDDAGEQLGGAVRGFGGDDAKPNEEISAIVASQTPPMICRRGFSFACETALHICGITAT